MISGRTRRIAAVTLATVFLIVAVMAVAGGSLAAPGNGNGSAPKANGNGGGKPAGSGPGKSGKGRPSGTAGRGGNGGGRPAPSPVPVIAPSTAGSGAGSPSAGMSGASAGSSGSASVSGARRGSSLGSRRARHRAARRRAARRRAARVAAIARVREQRRERALSSAAIARAKSMPELNVAAPVEGRVAVGGSDSANFLRERAAASRAAAGVPLAFQAALLTALFLVALLSVIAVRERRRSSHVQRVAQLDHLTGLANREGFDRRLAGEWRRAVRYGRPLGVVYIDLDDFKRFNDSHGHLAGDRLLREVAAVITSTARGSDFTARLGGDEFVILCPEATEEGLAALVGRLRSGARGLAVGLSIGPALQEPEDAGPDDLVHRADALMYEAKNERRRFPSTANPMLGSLRGRR